MTTDDLVAELRMSAERAAAGIARIEAANVARGLPADSPVILGEEALAAALEVQAANQRQSEIIDQLLNE
jgi:hypothetical protein